MNNKNELGEQADHIKDHIKDHIIVELDKFSAHYPERTALKNLSMKFSDKETYAILGPSGCGKTTLLYSIAGLLPADSWTDGECKRMEPMTISTVLQDFGLFPWKTVLENTMLPLTLKGKPTPEDLEKAQDLLKSLKLDTHQHHYPNALSGGQKQRVAIARSWLMAPDLLLLDEPFSALDALTRERLQDDVVNLYKNSPLCIIIVTHSIEEAVFIGKNIILLSENGEMQAEFRNPSFGLENVREQNCFYEQCLAIRKLMNEEVKI
jgi:NitT/TauT family transport system ATP-binding protein